MSFFQPSRLDGFVGTATNLLLAITAAVAIGVLVRREFSSSPALKERTLRATNVDKWNELRSLSSVVSSANNAVEIIEIGDFECPACKSFSAVLDAVTSKYPGITSVRFMHFPLNFHASARNASMAALCAEEQGKFASIFDLLYAKQDSLAAKAALRFALDAGIADAGRFETCLAEPRTAARIDSSLALGRELGVKGTPTIIVDGMMLSGVPNIPELDSIVRSRIRATARSAR